MRRTYCGAGSVPVPFELGVHPRTTAATGMRNAGGRGDQTCLVVGHGLDAEGREKGPVSGREDRVEG